MTALASAGLVLVTVLVVTATADAWRAAPARARVAGLGRRTRLPPAAERSWLAAQLADTGVPGRPGRWAALWLGSVVTGVGAGAAAGGPVLAAMALVATSGGPWLVLGARRGRSTAAVEAALPPVLEATARGMRAGASLPLALAAAAAGSAPAVAGDLSTLSAGASDAGLVAALDRWAADRPLPGVRLAAAALALAFEVGGGGARALDGVALTLRQRQAAAGEVRALATQARLSAGVLTVAPLVFSSLAAAGDPRTAAVLFRSPIGQGCLAVGLILDAAGAAWMARITRAGAA